MPYSMLKSAFLRMYATLAKANHVALITDTRPDGDTFGSSLAFGHWLRGLGKRVTHVASTPAPSSMQFLPGMDSVLTDKERLRDESIDVVCIFDSSRPEALKASLDVLPRLAPRLVFDHHASNPGFGDINAIDISACATCEVVYDFFEVNNISLTRDMASCLLMGMVTDTAAMTATSTNARMLQKTSRLMRVGGHVHTVVRDVVQASRLPRLQLWGRILSRCVEHPRFACVTTYVRQADLEECGAEKEDVDEVSDYLARSLQSPITVFLKELPHGEGIKVSLRSHGPSVLALAQAFGGGGHHGACGFTVPGRLEETESGVLIK